MTTGVYAYETLHRFLHVDARSAVETSAKKLATNGFIGCTHASSKEPFKYTIILPIPRVVWSAKPDSVKEKKKAEPEVQDEDQEQEQEEQSEQESASSTVKHQRTEPLSTPAVTSKSPAVALKHTGGPAPPTKLSGVSRIVTALNAAPVHSTQPGTPQKKPVTASGQNQNNNNNNNTPNVKKGLFNK